MWAWHVAVPVSPAGGTHTAPLVSKGSAMGDPGAGETSFRALPYGWPSGECVLVILTPAGPQGERVWSLLPGNRITWAFLLDRLVGTLPMC